LPDLASEVVSYLESACQAVPPGLTRIADSVALGTRLEACRWSSNDGNNSKDDNSILAQPEELGDWHADGMRCWWAHESKGDEVGKAAGWFLLCTGGKLQSHAGPGTWVLSDSKRLKVDLGGERHELEFRKRWSGKRFDHFVTVGAGFGRGRGAARGLVGWASKGKTHRFESVSGQEETALALVKRRRSSEVVSADLAPHDGSPPS